ncbi:MAG: YceI family protein [Bacteroidota bacterium]
MKPLKIITGTIALLAIVSATPIAAQNIRSTEAELSFYSKTPMEDIAAVNKKANAVINTATKDIAVLAKQTHFVFPNGLMQEHFNENYMESEKYPNAIFKGHIIDPVDFSKPGKYPVHATGTLEMHGVSKPKTLEGTIEVTDKGSILVAEFPVPLEEYNIERPSVVMMKIADKIDVKARFVFPPVQAAAQKK